MIPLSLVLVVVSATTLGFGVFDFSSSGRRRDRSRRGRVGDGFVSAARTVPVTVPDGTGPATGPAVPVGSASAGCPGAFPDAVPTRCAQAPRFPRGPGLGVETWPWATTPPRVADPGSRPGWGPAPAVQPPLPVDPPLLGGPDSPGGPAARGRLRCDPRSRRAHWPPSGPGRVRRGRGARHRAGRGPRLRVAQLDDEVVVVDGHPRYHHPGRRHTSPWRSPAGPGSPRARSAGRTPPCGPPARHGRTEQRRAWPTLSLRDDRSSRSAYGVVPVGPTGPSCPQALASANSSRSSSSRAPWPGCTPPLVKDTASTSAATAAACSRALLAHLGVGRRPAAARSGRSPPARWPCARPAPAARPRGPPRPGAAPA